MRGFTYVTTHFGFKSKDSFVNQDFSHEIQMKYAFLLVIVSLPMKMECEDFTNILCILLHIFFELKIQILSDLDVGLSTSIY